MLFILQCPAELFINNVYWFLHKPKRSMLSRKWQEWIQVVVTTLKQMAQTSIHVYKKAKAIIAGLVMQI